MRRTPYAGKSSIVVGVLVALNVGTLLFLSLRATPAKNVPYLSADDTDIDVTPNYSSTHLQIHQRPLFNEPISSYNNSLLEQNAFTLRLGIKRALTVSEVRTRFLACITEQRVPETNRKWGSEFTKHLYDCMALHVPVEKYELEALKGINVEHKYFLPMDPAYRKDNASGNSPCLWLTVGIGRDTKAEKEFLKHYPDRCRLYGVELVPGNEADFSSFGTAILAGLAPPNGPAHGDYSRTPTVMKDYVDYTKKKYSKLQLKELEWILDADVGSRLVHYVTWDIDGHEFALLRQFEDNGRYEKQGIVMCQMEIEFHPEMDGVVASDFEFGTFLLHLFHHASAYLPVHAAPYYPDHPWAIKMTLINVKNGDCERAFRFSRYFAR